MWNRRTTLIYLALWTFKGIAAILRTLLLAVSRQGYRPNRRRLRVEVQPGRESRAIEPLKAQAFVQINAPGFGHRWNTYPWSMQWWRGKLYVGTDKAYGCIEYFMIHRYL